MFSICSHLSICHCLARHNGCTLHPFFHIIMVDFHDGVLTYWDEEQQKEIPANCASVKTSDKKVATVDAKGTVTGKKAGKATISVKANGKTVKVAVTVKKK